MDHKSVEELARETLGSDTCDARRSASDGNRGSLGPCEFKRGLRTLFPEYKFPGRRSGASVGVSGVARVSNFMKMMGQIHLPRVQLLGGSRLGIIR